MMQFVSHLRLAALAWHLCKEWVVIRGDDNQDGYGLVWLISLHLPGMRCNNSWRQLWWLWWPPLLSSTSITHLPATRQPTRYLALENTVIWEIWKSSWNLNLRLKRISGAVDIPLPRLHLTPPPCRSCLVNVGTERRISDLPPTRCVLSRLKNAYKSFN